VALITRAVEFYQSANCAYQIDETDDNNVRAHCFSVYDTDDGRRTVKFGTYLPLLPYDSMLQL